MKFFNTLLILSICNFNYAQKLTKENITTLTFDHIFNELIVPEKYTIEECKSFGELKGEFDYSNGQKLILQLHGAFMNGCMTCIYDKYGYSSYFFAPDDVLWDNVNTFFTSYNTTMLSHLPKEIQDELTSSKQQKKVIFSSHLATLVIPTIKKESDSTLNLKLYSDTLENLFTEAIDSLEIGIKFNIHDKDSIVCRYNEIKNTGVSIKKNDQNILRIHITLNFKNMPANYDICWCPVLENKYRITIPVKLK